MKGRWVIGVDLGGTKVAVGAVSSGGAMVARRLEPTPVGKPPEESLGFIAAMVRDVMADSGFSEDELAGIGIGAPGPLDPVSGVIYFAPNLGWRNVPLRGYFEQQFQGLSIRVENDANAAAMGEHIFGAGKGFRHMIYATVSTGIGGGIILNNELYTGATGGAGEIGHLTVLPNGPRCGCGRLGCLEALASGTAIGRAGREHVASGGGGALSGLDPETIDAAAVGAAAREGDPAAAAILSEAFTYLGRAFTTTVNILNPQAIVVGGGVSALWDLMEPHITRELRAGSVQGFAEAVTVKRAILGGNVGVYGAAALFKEEAGFQLA